MDNDFHHAMLGRRGAHVLMQWARAQLNALCGRCVFREGLCNTPPTPRRSGVAAEATLVATGARALHRQEMRWTTPRPRKHAPSKL